MALFGVLACFVEKLQGLPILISDAITTFLITAASIVSTNLLPLNSMTSGLYELRLGFCCYAQGGRLRRPFSGWLCAQFRPSTGFLGKWYQDLRPEKAQWQSHRKTWRLDFTMQNGSGGHRDALVYLCLHFRRCSSYFSLQEIWRARFYRLKHWDTTKVMRYVRKLMFFERKYIV